MRKYLYSFRLYFLNSFHYRFNALVNLLFGNLSMLITILFWRQIYAGDFTRAINGFTLPGIITYFLVGGIFRAFVLQGSGFDLSGMIKRGALGPMLLRPHRVGLVVYFRNLATSLTGLIPQALFLACLTPWIARYMSWQMTPRNALAVLAFLLISSASSHLLWSLLGYMAFWLEEAGAVLWSFAVLLNFTTGLFIPLDFFPKWSIAVLEVLPFAAWGYLPTKIYLGLLAPEKQLFLLLTHAGWIAILLLINRFVWRNGVRKYSSVGG